MLCKVKKYLNETPSSETEIVMAAGVVGSDVVRLILVWGVASLVNILAERGEWPVRSPRGLG